MKSVRGYHNNLPLSEGSEEYLESFAEDYDRYVPHSSSPGPLTRTLAHL